MIVVIGERDWTRFAPCADVLLGYVATLQDVPDTCARLFRCYPGLSLVALRTPAGLVLAVHPVRRDRSGGWNVPATVAAASYFALAAACGVDARPQPRAKCSGPGGP